MDKNNNDPSELAFIRDKVTNIENIVFSNHKNIKTLGSLIVEYRSYLADIKNSVKEQSKEVTSLSEKLDTLLKKVTDEIEGNTPASKRCKYSDKQLYELHYGIGCKKKYSLADLVGLTGMSKSFIQQHIRKYMQSME